LGLCERVALRRSEKIKINNYINTLGKTKQLWISTKPQHPTPNTQYPIPNTQSDSWKIEEYGKWKAEINPVKYSASWISPWWNKRKISSSGIKEKEDSTRQVGQAGQGKQKTENGERRTENGRLWDFVREWLWDEARK